MDRNYIIYNNHPFISYLAFGVLAFSILFSFFLSFLFSNPNLFHIFATVFCNFAKIYPKPHLYSIKVVPLYSRTIKVNVL